MIRSAPIVIGVVAALSLSACASAGDASTSSSTSSPSETSSSSSSSTSTAEATIDGPEDKELTLKEAKAALPKLSALPKGYEKHSGSTADKSDEGNVLDTDPKKCAALFFEDRKAIDHRDEHMVAVAHRRYAIPSDGGPEPLADISVDVVSHDEPYPLRLFDAAGAALAECGMFTMDEFDITTTTIASPALGDRTFVFRMEVVNDAYDFLFVRSGHNIIRVRAKSGVEEHDATLMKELATTVLDNLEE